MANGSTLSTARRDDPYVGSKIRDSISLLDVVYADHFEGDSFDPDFLYQVEENFYKGAPPNWFNFYISEQSDFDTGTSLIKRDGYSKLKDQIESKRRIRAISTVKLFHQSGSGGTTMAMQVLWDLRKTFRCAALTGPTSDITKVAQEVVQLFTGGSQNQKNTVLLLVSDEQILDKLKQCILSTVAENKITTNRPVAILLGCVRKDVLLESDNVVLKRELSHKEEQEFRKKRKELEAKYSDISQLHGFNIMQTNLSERYIKKACEVFRSSRKAKRPRKAQLAAFLALLNAYAPGSYLLESECLDFLRYKNGTDNDRAVEELMQPFSHLIVTFQQNDETKRRVRMAHPLIAKCSTEILASTGVTRSDTTRNFLNDFCKYKETEEFPQCLLGFVNDMLTKREAKTQDKTTSDAKEDQERFSKLILDIQKMESRVQCASVLKAASKKLNENPFFPQALSRFYYIEMKHYDQAEMWAKTASQRDPKNSYIADTLGQVHKNHLKAKKATDKPREILKLAKDAIEAFKHEEQLAEDEQETDMKEDGMIQISNVFNSRGQFGFLQVCKILYDLLVSNNETWREVLTKNVSLCSVLHILGDSKLYRFNDLIKSLKEEVERKSEFFDKYLTYSKYSTEKEDPEYIFKDTTDCYRKYVGDLPLKNATKKIAQAIQMLKKNRAATSAGVLACLDRAHTEKDLKEIATWWKEIWSSQSPGAAEVNYMLALIMLVNTGETIPASSKPFKKFEKKIPLSERDPPEQHMLALLLFWPANSEDECEFDLSQRIQLMHVSYEHTYQKHFRSRYLQPLFFIGKGQRLARLVHRKVVEQLFHQTNEAKLDWNNNWRNESIFLNNEVQERLLRIVGLVRNYRVFATVSGTQIEIEANSQRNLWSQRKVSFYIGFTIRGPVAFSIQTENDSEVHWRSSRVSRIEASPSQASNAWIKLKPKEKMMDTIPIYSLQSEEGHYECSVSALRWVCKKKVEFRYHYKSWEERMRNPLFKKYMPASPLLDITVTAGEMEEVQLPHWICLGHTKPQPDMFAVLHVDNCGDLIEETSGVTSSHVKLLHPAFSPRGALLLTKLGFPLKVFYDVLIYKNYNTDKAALTLRVYVIPPDPAVKQAVDSEERSDGFRRIRKPGPDKSLQLESHYFLTTDCDTAQINPEKRTLTSERRNYSTDFFEVFVENAKHDFHLTLTGEKKKSKRRKTVWMCIIRTNEYQNEICSNKQGEHFVDLHRLALIERVKETGAILDRLLEKKLISDEVYGELRHLETPQNKMREIFKHVTSAGNQAKHIFEEILRGIPALKLLMSELSGLH